MRVVFLIFAILVMVGCRTPIGQGMQKGLNIATLGLINDPYVSEATKAEIVSQRASQVASRASQELRYETFKPYHHTALATFMLGLFIAVGSSISIPFLSFLTKGMWKVGAWVMVGAGALSLFATLMADVEVIHYLGWAIGILGIGAIAFLLIRLFINQKKD